MSEDRVLPIDRAPAAKRIPAEQLGHLNAAFYLAQLRQSEAQLLEAKARLAVMEAEKAAQGFMAIRDAIAGDVGVEPTALRWDVQSGEVVRQ